MPFVVNAALVSLLARSAFMHHTDPSRKYQPCRVSMMRKCSTSVLVTRSTLTHHDNKGHDGLQHTDALKGLRSLVGAPLEVVTGGSYTALSQSLTTIS